MKQIQTLNNTVKCKLAPSKIHGVGVFAIRNIRKGEKLYCQETKRLWLSIPFKDFHNIREEIRELIIQRYPSVKEGSMFLSPNADALLQSFMNESDNPNYKDDIALKDIKKREEITENYVDL